MNSTDFRIGDRVEMTEKGIQRGLDGKLQRRIGTVVGYGRKPDSFRVTRDGRKYSETWDKSFWAHKTPTP